MYALSDCSWPRIMYQEGDKCGTSHLVIRVDIRILGVLDLPADAGSLPNLKYALNRQRQRSMFNVQHLKTSIQIW